MNTEINGKNKKKIPEGNMTFYQFIENIIYLLKFFF